MQRTVSPIDGRVIVERPLASASDVDAALERAALAQREWKRRPLSERAELCSRMVDVMVARTDAIAEELTRQMGRPLRDSPSELRGFEERARYMIEIASEALSDKPAPALAGFRRFIRAEPLGVVFVVAPWNYPYLTSVNAVVPALMAGNTVVLKHSGQTPLCAERYTEACQEAGFPTGVFQHLHLDHDAVATTVADPRVAFVAFTGSVPGGHAVQRAAAGRFIGTGLELGGKDPAYVRADADLSHAMDNLVDGAFYNGGQSCCGIERIYVDRRVFDDFVQGYVQRVGAYRLGDPLQPSTTLGPLVRTAAADFVRDQVAQAIVQGARPLIDAGDFAADRGDSAYLAPQVLIEVDHGMRVMTEETFGPVVGIMPVEGDEQAVELMNDSQYGLTAAIWTRDPEAAMAVGERVDTGTFFMNRCDYLDPALAWTGVKDSGRGCTLSSLGYNYLTRPKSFHLRLSP